MIFIRFFFFFFFVDEIRCALYYADALNSAYYFISSVTDIPVLCILSQSICIFIVQLYTHSLWEHNLLNNRLLKCFIVFIFISREYAF